CELLAGEQLREKEDNVLTLIRLIEDATDEEMDAVLLTIGRKWKESRLNSAIPLDYSQNLDSAIAV
ncbi:MAG: XRE family transcriptional regulator, partial [Nostoc sp.]